MLSRAFPSRVHPVHARRLWLGLLVAALLWLLTPPGLASAHAHLVRADPAPDSVIAHAPSVASFTFDEPLNPALTRIHISDASGRSVTTDTGHLAAGHDGAVWQLTLPHLTSGTYSVFWTSESATDGHVMSSFYTFRVAPTGGADGAAPVTLGESRADLLRSLDAATVAAPYRWTFGDGTTALGHVVTHRYTRPGLYLVGVAGFNGQTRQWFPFDKALLRVVPPGQVIQSNLGYYGLRALDIAMSALMWIVDGGLVLLIVGVIISRQTTSAPRES